jgi:hypothetical protein
LKALLLLFLAAPAFGQACAKLEFAELDAMPKEDLLRIRCEYNATMMDPRLTRSSALLPIADRCARETSRMDRIIARKYKLPSPSDPNLPHYAEINAMCRK